MGKTTPVLYPAQIWIGGTIKDVDCEWKKQSLSIFEILVKTLYLDRASHNGDDEYIGTEQDCSFITDQELLLTYLKDGLLTFKTDQAVYGEFIETEQFCMDNKIAFDRYSQRTIQYDAEKLFYRPYLNYPVVNSFDCNGVRTVDASMVNEAIEILKYNNSKDDHSKENIYEVLLNLLTRHDKSNVKTLEQLEIV